jgi:hypothetical protein
MLHLSPGALDQALLAILTRADRWLPDRLLRKTNPPFEDATGENCWA